MTTPLLAFSYDRQGKQQNKSVDSIDEKRVDVAGSEIKIANNIYHDYAMQTSI